MMLISWIFLLGSTPGYLQKFAKNRDQQLKTLGIQETKVTLVRWEGI